MHIYEYGYRFCCGYLLNSPYGITPGDMPITGWIGRRAWIGVTAGTRIGMKLFNGDRKP